MAVALTLVGVAFGISNMYINQAILAHAQRGQEDATSGAVPTLHGLGGAISAAVAGLAGNAIGLDRALTPHSVGLAALVLYGGGAVLSVLASVMAFRLLAALKRRG